MNPLSLAAHSGASLDALLRQAVIQLGCPEERLAELDQHATLAIQLQALPDVMVSALDDRLWVWSILPGLSEARLHAMAAETLAILLEPVEDVESGQLALGRGEHGYELKALVRLDCLSRDGGLQPVLAAFIERLRALCQTLNLTGE
ncbi:hypothetical protein [Chromobacterium subtsugae]|uniref:InvB/SpaK family type III secretion system chaperone n=1 Tax=Chromobacterium subtsugae TaxID=251747 RepID=UPI000640BD0A|nr:hypothetical protein [Chromobacterium subtsugae]